MVDYSVVGWQVFRLYQRVGWTASSRAAEDFCLSLVLALFLFWLISWSVGWLFVADGGWTPSSRGAEAGRGHTMAVFLRLPTSKHSPLTSTSAQFCLENLVIC